MYVPYLSCPPEMHRTNYEIESDTNAAVQLVRNEGKCRRKQVDAGERMEGQMTPTDHSLQVPD